MSESDTPPILIVDDQEKLLRLIVMLMTRIGFPDVEASPARRRPWSGCGSAATLW